MIVTSAPDFTDMRLFAEGAPWAAFEELRRNEPVSWSAAPSSWDPDEGPGYWNLVRAADISAVTRDSQTFSSWRGGVTIPSSAVGSLDAIRAMMIGKDPPEHSAQRTIVNSAFLPGRIAALEAQVRANVRHVINAVIERGQCDLVAEISAPLPMSMVADLLGVPENDRSQLFRWTDAIVGFNDPDAALSSADAVAEATAYMMELDRERQRKPADDLITVIGRAEVNGERLALEQRAGIFIHLFAAGVDTTRATLALGMEALIGHPEEKKKLAEDPSLIATAVEEINRWTSVVLYMRRTAMCDTEIGGRKIREGDAVVCWQAAGNRDPELFDDPYRFDVSRASNRHLAFGGGGRHLCLGASLARLELRIAFQELLRRCPDLELAGPPQRIPANWLQNVKKMPVRFTPGRIE